MSSLNKTIEKLRNDPDFYSDPKKAIDHLKDEITNIIKSEDQKKNLRIYEPDGGLIRGGNNRSRDKEKVFEKELNLLLDKKHFIDKKMELLYFKAVFNSPGRLIKTNVSNVQMIGYECPLIRLYKSSKNLTSRYVSCDLVGISSNQRIICIEGKVKPETKDTDIVYGIFESYAYGICMNYLVSNSENLKKLKNEINESFKKFHQEEFKKLENEKKIFTGYLGTPKAAYCLAAPKEYFHYFINSNDDQTKMCLDQAEKLIKFLSENEEPEWAGFFVLEPSCEIKNFKLKHEQTNEKGADLVAPHFNCGPVKALVAKTIDELKENLKI